MPGYLKLNTDAAIDLENNRVGFGWVLRDDCGQFVAASSIPGEGASSPKEAEAMAIREALSWTKRINLHNVQIECDAQLVVQSLNHVQEVSSCDLVLLDVIDMLRSLTGVAISYVNRTANSVAHNLAREACSMSVRQEWVSTPPSCIVNELCTDLS
ncbi:PREDICTED: uncharacterized protein LOC109192287 [Ipomoea nil]|uniref:uncharacterized protein LOC109192287 n=1 Tax=Ipomoea nil TaxID=35883 RepID=UPI0009012513|nr:PREDICTED: uncharacterized protein LOC109192287 [Ipomoea nil]